MGGLVGRGRLRVTVGQAERQPEPGAAVPLAFIALQPAEGPMVGERLPQSRVRAPRVGRDGLSVEQLRFDPRADLSALPGLSGPAPSRLRDAVRLALAAGAAFCDALIVRVPGALPWELARPELRDALGPLLDSLYGAVIGAPDLLGPPALGPTDPLPPEARQERALANLAALAPGLRSRHQLGLFDPVGPDLVHDQAAASAAGSADLALCGWRGGSADLSAHGWRSAAAVVAGLLARPDHPMIHGVDGLSVDLPRGRPRPSDRPARLGAWAEGPPGPDESDLRIHLQVSGDRATPLGDATLRRPLLTWPLPALRTASILHLRLLRAAEAFVFRPVQPIHAFALGMALEQVVRPLAEAGVIVGGEGRGAPQVRADVSRDPAIPGFVAEVTGQLRPWCRAVNIRVAVRAEGVALEMVA